MIGVDSRKDLLAVSGGYGAADIGMTVGREYPVTVMIRKMCTDNPALAEVLFQDTRGHHSTLPSLLQYNPAQCYIEAVDGELAFTVLTGIPLVRYIIRDTGGVMDFAEMMEVLKRHGQDPYAELAKIGYGPEQVWKMPFFWVYGRSDGTVSIVGANVFPENIQAVLADAHDSDVLTFKLKVETTAEFSQRLVISLEYRSQELSEDRRRRSRPTTTSCSSRGCARSTTTSGSHTTRTRKPPTRSFASTPRAPVPSRAIPPSRTATSGSAPRVRARDCFSRERVQRAWRPADNTPTGWGACGPSIAMAVGMDVTRLAIIIVVALANLGLALAVFLRNKRSGSNRAFAAAVVAIVCWLAFAYLSDLPQLADYALLLNRLTLASAMWMGAFLLRFAIIFPSRDARLPLPWKVYMWFGLFLGVATLATPLVVAEIRFRPGGTDIVAGVGFWLLVAWAITGVIGCVVALARKYRRAEGRERTQLKFMLLGFAGFALSSVVFGLILPSVTGNYRLAELNTFSSLVLVSVFAYVIVRHRLMDLRLAVLRASTHTLLYSPLASGSCGSPSELGTISPAPSTRAPRRSSS